VKASQRNWQSDYLELVTRLKEKLMALDNDAQREQVIDRMRRVVQP